MSWLPRLRELGELTLVDTFVEYDGPRVFSARSATGQLYLAGWAEEGQDGDSWLYLPISELRLRMVVTGRRTLREAFTSPESVVLRVLLHHDARIPDSAEPLNGSDLLDEWLPAEDFTLQIALPTLVPAVTPAELARTAEQEGRTRIRIEIDDPARMRSEASTRRVAALLTATQNVVDNFGLVELDADPKQDGRFSKQVLARMETDVLQLAAASFVIELGSTDGDDLLGDSPIARVTDRLVRLLAVGLTSEELWEALADLRPRAAKSFRGFVNELANTNSNVTVAMANSAHSYRAESLTAQQIASLRSLLKSIVPDEVRRIRGRMVLYLGDNERRLFGLKDLASAENFEGRVGELAIPQVSHATLGEAYDVVLTSYTQLDKGAAGETTEKLILEQLELASDNAPVPMSIETMTDLAGPLGFPTIGQG